MLETAEAVHAEDCLVSIQQISGRFQEYTHQQLQPETMPGLEFNIPHVTVIRASPVKKLAKP